MFSKLTGSSRISASLVLSAALVLSACARVGEEPPPPAERGLESTQCLSDASRVMSEFVKGNAKTDEVGGAWNCFGGAFESFYKYVRGSDRDTYTPQELATYLENNFFGGEAKGTHIPAGLQTEFMKIKQIFVGGSRAVITRDEVLAVARLGRSLGKISQRVNPYMKVYLMSWTTTEGRLANDQKYFEDANTAIQDAASQLSALIQKKHDPYKLEDVAGFVDQLENFLNADWDMSETIRQFLPVARKVKHALAGGDESQILPTEWKRILLLGSRTYIQYLRYHYFIEKELSENPGANRPFPMDYVARTFEDTFSIFEDMVREKPTGVVSRAEVIEICAALSKAWPKFKYSDDFIAEIMKVKQALVGGSLDAFAASDFQNARLKVSTVKVIIGRVLPFMDVYLGDWAADSLSYQDALSRFNSARTAFDQSLSELGGVLESSYNIKNVAKLVGELEELYPPANPGDGSAKTIASYLPLVVQIKNMLFNDDDSVVKKTQWPAFFGYAGNLLGTYRFYGYFLKGKSDLKKETYDAMSQTTNQTLGLFSTLMKIRGRDLITTAEVKQLVLSLQDIGMIPKEISPDTIDSLVKVILNRILNPPDRRLVGQVPNGINPVTLAYVQSELQGWIQTQSFLLDVMAKSRNGLTVTPSSVRKMIGDKIADANTTPELKEALSGLNIAIGGDLPFVLDQGGRLLISRRLDPDLNLPSLQRHNLIREITRILLASYAESASRIRKNVSSSEAERAFKELKAVAIDYGLIDPSNTNFMTNRFREANLFMPRSDGDTTATFAEVHELIFAIMSGLKLNNSLRPALVRDCPPSTARSRGRTIEKVNYACLYENYKKGFRTYLTSMPEFLRFQRNSSDADFGLFFFNSMKGAGYVPSGSSVKLSDVSLLPQLIQYEELLFARFDTNADGVIGVSEAKRAFPAFKEIFKLLAKKELADGTLKDADLLGVFMWVLKYGKPPETIWEKLQLLSWLKSPDSWDSTADRSKIASILGYIADQLAKQ